MSMYEQGKKAADEGADMARETIRKGRAKAEQAVEATQETVQMAGDSARQMNLKLLEIMRSNTETFFEFAEELASVRDPSQLVEIWTRYAQKQMESLGKHGQELTSLGQRLATNNMEALSNRAN
jgi:hypothetical protein